MLAPTTSPEPRTAPVCPTCAAPMALLRSVAPVPQSELRVFMCKSCGIAMFTEIA